MERSPPPPVAERDGQQTFHHQLTAAHVVPRRNNPPCIVTYSRNRKGRLVRSKTKQQSTPAIKPKAQLLNGTYPVNPKQLDLSQKGPLPPEQQLEIGDNPYTEMWQDSVFDSGAYDREDASPAKRVRVRPIYSSYTYS